MIDQNSVYAITGLRNTQKRLYSNILHLHNEVLALKSQNNNSKSLLSSKDTLIAKLNETIETLETKLSSVEQTVQDMESKYAKFNEKLENLENVCENILEEVVIEEEEVEVEED